MSDDDDNSSVPSDIMDFRGDSAPIAMDSYRDNVIDDRQQSVLNDLRIHLCQEDFAYLNNTKVEAIATLLLKEMFRSEPDDLYAHAARYLSDPKFKDLLADFKRSEDRLARDLLDQNEKIYGDDLVTETRSQQMTRLYSLFGESEEPLAPRTP